ncbi:MAG: arsenate reductase (glutaredoxin) [Hyphomicrobiaceae bacterium]
MAIVIYHNPACQTSRNTLAMIEASGVQPVVINYLECGWTRPQLLGLFAAAGLTAREALRTTKSPADQLGLIEPAAEPQLDEQMLLAAMVAHPILVNRPFVCSPRGVRLCRPSEVVLDLLDDPHRLDGFVKPDGDVVRLNGR